jgi:hypothetical protein
VCIVSALLDSLERADTLTVSDALEAEVARRRVEGSGYWIDVKHVGGPDDPLAYWRLAGAEDAARRRARNRALAKVQDSDPDRSAAIGNALAEDGEWLRDLGECAKAWIVAGVVNGADELLRLWELGCKRGASHGCGLLVQAAHEVRAAQEVSEDLGKG